MIVIPYYDGYVLDVPVQANDVLVLLIQQILLMFHSREEIEALQGPGCIPWWISCNDSCSLVCAPTLQINFRPPTLKPLFLLFIISTHKIMKRVLHIVLWEKSSTTLWDLETVFLDEAEVLASRLNQIVLHIMFCMILKNYLTNTLQLGWIEWFERTSE